MTSNYIVIILYIFLINFTDSTLESMLYGLIRCHGSKLSRFSQENKT